MPFVIFFLSFSYIYIYVVFVYLRIYVRVHLATPCVSANDNVKHVKLNITHVFDKQMKKMKSM